MFSHDVCAVVPNSETRQEARYESVQTRTLFPMVTGTSVLGMKFDDGVLIAADNLGSYGSLAKYRSLSRLMRVNDSTVLGVSGDYADFQFIKKTIEQMMIKEECLDDGFLYSPKSIFCWLTRVMYNRRTKGNPLWVTVVVGGMQDGKPFLGYIDKLGMAYEEKTVASGYGGYIAQPLMREVLELRQDITKDGAKELLENCMKVLYYRDARSWNEYEIASVTTADKANIEGPFAPATSWDIAREVSGYE